MTSRALLAVSVLALGAGVPAAASTGRLLTVDAAEPVDRFVLGLQRTAIGLPGGFAIDTALLADLGLLPNAGLRWSLAAGPHRVVVGARYAHFVGTQLYSTFVNGQESQVQRFEPRMSGPSAYAVYGFLAGQLLAQAEVRFSAYGAPVLSVTAAGAFAFGPQDPAAGGVLAGWAVIVEAGYRLMAMPATPPYRAAAGLRYAGEHFGITAGAAYVGLSDPLFPQLPVLPVVDLSWTF